AYPASSKNRAQLSQLLGSSQSPWMNTTGVLPLALACSTCCVSRWVIEAISSSFPAAHMTGSRSQPRVDGLGQYVALSWEPARDASVVDTPSHHRPRSRIHEWRRCRFPS